MEINKKRTETVKDCKNVEEVKDAILQIIYDHEIMADRTDSKELAYESLVPSIEWFLDPENPEKN